VKHNIKVTLALILLFLAAQLIGILIVNHYLQINLPLNIERPEVDQGTSFISIALGILLATILAFMLIRFKAMKIWKSWFFLSVVFCLTISFGAILTDIFAIIVATILAYFKVFKPNVYIHNFTELFIYGGIASVFVPILNLVSIAILIFILAIYDAIAVWKTGHMIKLAKFQAKSKLFAGLLVQYPAKLVKTTKKIKSRVVHNAILGGGDIAIPLLFSGVILKTFGMIPALISIIISTITITCLFFFAQKKKFYPAIPFLAIGCLISYLLIILIS